ncbi:hypothetical protein [Bradyrhizobium sp. SRS-191]|uniref:hypothetical protein n=1 Tax=Bradyrhizobium sp. SRS-191 TaxID=2962606 RepID=UPI00211DDE3C|nr:hypothetical protein [Bradyrhizobium sp. SRS-191]
MSRDGATIGRLLANLSAPRHSGAIVEAQTRSGCVAMIEPEISKSLSMNAQANLEIPGSRPAALPRNDGECGLDDSAVRHA